MLSTIGDIVRDLLIVVGALTVLLVVVVIVAVKMPAHNPIKRVLTGLCWRLGATVAAGLFAIPIEAIPAADLVYDVGAPVVLLLYWISFFKNAGRMMSDPSARRGAQITHDGR